ncbi:DEAD/DEAH box helicase [Hyphomicrobium sp.]|uniref:DEAD/DEAH box helicase n=1 Tax=Hyphomicrobium sp. TaxID=82 RepID=UPI003F71998C
MTFPSTHPALARAIAARGYTSATAVQTAVLEADAAGRDLVVSAQTGSGKTVAFGLAFAPTLLGTEERLPTARAPMALVIAPTRELAMQVQRELIWLYRETGARVVTCVGGMDARAEARNLASGAHIVVGTPGRLRDHLERQRLDLASLKTIVLDEADEMLDLGFREDLEFILEATPPTRQTLLFSATMPREIENLARRYQRDAVRIATTRGNEQHIDIEYRAIRVAPFDIENAVVNVLRFHEAAATLVFCATRESVKRMHARLVERGFAAVALSGELTQNERTHALQAVRDGRARVLVATDVAARGLDLPALALVIHADLPNDAETLLHRSGRTGRAGKKGLCTLIVPFNRRRKADVLLAGAKLKVTWGTAPTAEEIRARDQERFLTESIFTDAVTPDETPLVEALKAARSVDEIALALVRIHRSRLPAPEDLAEDRGPPTRDDRARPAPGRDRFSRPDRERPAGRDRPPRARPAEGFDSAAPREPRTPRPLRDDGREMVWFTLSIGRERNADPRWLLPIICRAGNVTKSEIGAIRIQDNETRFQVVAEVADTYADTVRTNRPKEGRIARVGAPPEAGENTGSADAAPRAPRPAAKDRAPTERATEAPPRERDKSRWRDRGNDKPSHGPRKADSAKPHSAREHSHKPRTQSGAPGKPQSKYSHKKKQRPAHQSKA